MTAIQALGVICGLCAKSRNQESIAQRMGQSAGRHMQVADTRGSFPAQFDLFIAVKQVTIRFIYRGMLITKRLERECKGPARDAFMTRVVNGQSNLSLLRNFFPQPNLLRGFSMQKLLPLAIALALPTMAFAQDDACLISFAGAQQNICEGTSSARASNMSQLLSLAELAIGQVRRAHQRQTT